MSIFLSLLTLTTPAPNLTLPFNTCTRFLVGTWAGKGTVRGFGKPVTVDSKSQFMADGTYSSQSRYLGEDKVWRNDKSSGSWSAEPGEDDSRCVVLMKSASDGFEISSDSEIEIRNQNIYQSMGLDMKRVDKSATTL